jgi:hypothetical protein
VTNPVSWLSRSLDFFRRYWLLVRQGRRETAAGKALIAEELDYNAEVVSHYPEDGSIHGVMEQVSLDAWETHSPKIHALTDEETWHALAAAYGDLRRTVARGAMPPKLQSLRTWRDDFEMARPTIRSLLSSRGGFGWLLTDLLLPSP